MIRFCRILLLVLTLIPLITHSQETITQEQILSLQSQINKVTGTERLVLLDSLTRQVEFRSDVNYDSIARQTIKLAVQLDSIHTAMYHTSGLMAYYNNYIGQPEQALELYGTYFKNHMDLLNAKDRSVLYLDLGDSHDFTGKPLKAIQYYDSAIAIGSKNKFKQILAKGHLYKGYVYSGKGDFALAVQSLSAAGELYRTYQDTASMIGVENSLAILYSQNAFYKEAAKNRSNAIKLAHQINSYENLVSLNFNQSIDYNFQGRHREEIHSLLESLKYAKRLERGKAFKRSIYPQLVIAYSITDSIEQAEKTMTSLKNLQQDSEDYQNSESYMKAAKHLAFAKANYPEALRVGKANLAYDRQNSGFEEKKLSLRFLSKVYEQLGMPLEAYNAFKESVVISDRIFNNQKVNALSYYQTLYETEKKEVQIANQKEKLAFLEHQNKLKNLYLIIGTLTVLSICGLLLYFYSKRQAHLKQEQQSQFAKQLIQTQESERIRIARDIHDSVGQKLVLLSRSCNENNFKEFNHLAGESLSELREISSGLYPMHLERLGLAASLKSMINQIDESNSILIDHSIDNLDVILSKDEQLQLYRVVQEAMNNIVKHSDAQEASINLKKSNTGYNLVIKDNGKGFDIDKFKMGLGIATMRQRARIIHAKFRVESSYKTGTIINLTS